MNKNSSLKKTPIAVIGLSAMFADARNVEEFWENIILSKDSITDVPDSRWSIADYYDADVSAPDKTYCKRGGFLPDIDFNPMEFGLPPNILEVTDASQLLGLVAARDAFEDAGYGKNSEKFTKQLKEKTGVLLGVGGGQKLISPLMSRLQYPIWEKALRASGISEKDIPPIVEKMKKAYVGWNENAFPGLLGNVISGRITNRFDLGGINSVVDAACAASLSAIKMSLSELVEGRCDMMLTGGVDTDNSPFMYMSFSKTPAFSKSGNISPFSDKADGMLIGEGLGMMVLKRLDDAERDGDRIYAVITGVGTSSDGRFKSVYAPRPAGQALAMNRAYEDAGYPASTVGLIEAHGTGTAAGDPTEFTSMQMVFGADNNEKQHIALGSVKSQVGHTKAAAGAAGMIKAVLGLYHNILPPTLNVEKPNSKFDVHNSAIYINTETRPWFRNGHPRRAGVSAFGFGGINVHITLEEYAGEKAEDYRLHQPYKSVLLHASGADQLIQACKEELNIMQNTEGETAFLKMAHAVKDVPPPSDARIGFIAHNQQECIGFLQLAIELLQQNKQAWDHPKGIYYQPSGVDLKTQKIVALFAGQGSQYIGMGRELVNSFPVAAHSFELFDKLYQKKKEKPLTQMVYPNPAFTKEEKKAQQQNLTKTEFAQPAIGALSMGQFKILKQAGFNPHFTAGHSFGELTALWAAEVIDDETFIALAKTRGSAMAATNPNADPGSMLAVKGSKEEISKEIEKIKDVQIANVNSLDQVVLGGSTQAIKAAEDHLSGKGYSVVPLPVSAAFHTRFVKHAEVPFAKFVSDQKFNKPRIPVYSNSSGKAYPADPEAVKTILNKQILNPVLFKDQVENIYNDGGRVFIEFGPKDILSKLVRNILEGKEFFSIAVNPNTKLDSDLQFRQATVKMRVLGIPLDEEDPYKREIPLPPEKTKMNVKVSGNNYVSEATQKSYQQSLNDGFKIDLGKETVVEKIIEVPVSNGDNQNENQDMMVNKDVIQLLQTTLESFKTNQTRSLDIFERLMSEQNQQSQQLINLLSNQINGNTIGNPDAGRIVQTEQHSNPIPSVAEAQKESPVENYSASPKVVASPQKASTPQTAPVSATKPSSASMEKALLEVVSEKTGYPAEMLELTMDMEADLGIDSIKRVEIFGALTQAHPEMGEVNPNELAELRTLAEIVSHVSGSAVTAVPAAAAAIAAAATSGAKTTSSQEQKSPASNSLEKALLNVVSEKTGYPAEMLEVNMDMEADLGIDSIKRVEIFGALSQQYPDMAEVNPNELTELRTLAEIIQHVSGSETAASPEKSSNVPDPAAATNTETAGLKATVTESAPEMIAAVLQDKADQSVVEKALLEVISEKTGYPPEMLEMNMDLEADLGIDSIKRVEIFGALTQQYPEIAGINANELTELRTLAEIVHHVSPSEIPTPHEITAAPDPVTETKTETATVTEPVTAVLQDHAGPSVVESALLEVISEKTGYPAEMLELNMDLEADLGIDSIKRVEIFGALTQQYPDMAEINPNELTELRTLQEIVDHVKEAQKKKVLAT